MSRISLKYVPSWLPKNVQKKLRKNIEKSRREYKKKVYVPRQRVKGYPKKESKHVINAKRMYGVRSMTNLKLLRQKTGCSVKSMNTILRKGRGAYYSSGSRPNQTAQSWARARLASALTGGPASRVDQKHLREGKCSKHVLQMISKKRTTKQVKRKKNADSIQGGRVHARVLIPSSVRNAAKLGLKLKKNGYRGGTRTGWLRGEQLAYRKTIDVLSLANMRAWFARHGPDAKNGGTSYPNYCRWLKKRSAVLDPASSRHKYRGAVAWLLWGGDPAYRWLKTEKIRRLLKTSFPKRKRSSRQNRLRC